MPGPPVSGSFALSPTTGSSVCREEAGEEFVMRTQFFAPRERAAPVSGRGQQDMLRCVREAVEVIAKQAGDTRRQLRRGQTPTGGAGLVAIENSCLNALAALDTVELPPPRSGASHPRKRKAHATLSGP